ncbi:MAG: hypothetical protein HY894_09495 [Deltaproteobacteria bacterium]|nr:hypothetical protein [Deltaproteobacteria bacterium]
MLDVDDIYLGQRYTPALASGASNAKATSVRIPPTVGTDNYYIIVMADATDTNAELDEGNNTASFAITVTRDIDMTVSALSGPASVVRGGTINVSNTVATAGSGTTAASYVKFYLSADNILDGLDAPLGQRSVGAITAAAPSSTVKSLTIPTATVAGSYFIIAKADATDTNAEYNEANNTASYPITVVRFVDLSITALTPPAGLTAGTTASVGYTVANTGTASATASYGSSTSRSAT